MTVLPESGSPSSRTRRRKRPVVSVCIVNWNCRDMLRDCLRSLRSRRQGVRVEVVVVDNASTDGAADMVAREFPRVKLIRNAEQRRLRPGQQPGRPPRAGAVSVLPQQRHARAGRRDANSWSITPGRCRAWACSGRGCATAGAGCNGPLAAGPRWRPCSIA